MSEIDVDQLRARARQAYERGRWRAGAISAFPALGLVLICVLLGAEPRFQMVMPLYVERFDPLVIDTLRAPPVDDDAAGTVKAILVSDQLLTVTPATVAPAAFLSVTEPVP